MNKAVVLDLDGTLMDTATDIMLSLNEMLNHYGYRTLDREGTVLRVNNGAKELVKKSLPEEVSEEKLNECYEYYRKIYDNSDCSNTYVYEGMKEFITACKNHGYKVCVATNKQSVKAVELCENVISDFKFDGILGVDNGVAPKPNPESTVKMLNKLNVKPENAYFIGDGETDVLTAINGNMKGICVLWGYRSKEHLMRFGAKVFVETPSDLFKLLDL